MAKRTRWPTYFFECCGGPTMNVTSVKDLFWVVDAKERNIGQYSVIEV